MSGEQPTGQDTPAITGEVTQTQVAAPNATPPETGTETVQENKDTPPAAKTFTQDELNDIVKRAKAATESKTERRVLRTLETLQRQQAPQHTQAQENAETVPPRREGESDAVYVRRLVQAELQREKTQQSVQSFAEKTDDHYAQAEKLPGFNREAFDELPLTPVLATTIAESDVAPKLMAYLCENAAEVDRLAKLSPARQAAELGKLETKVSQQAKPEVKAPKAPAPIDPIGGGRAPVTDLSRMSAEEYYATRMKQKPVWAR